VNSPPRGPFPFRIPWSSFQKLEAIRKNHDCFSLPDHLNYIIIQPTNLTPKHVSKNHGHQMNPTGLSWFVKLDSPIHNFILRVMQSVKVAIACVFFKQTKPHTKKKQGNPGDVYVHLLSNRVTKPSISKTLQSSATWRLG